MTNDVKAFGSQWRFSNDKARRELGWSPRVAIADGMNAALEYLRVSGTSHECARPAREMLHRAQGQGRF